jgi:hypothetical protein
LNKSERREVLHRLEVLSRHLLKWIWRPEIRLSGWRGTIITQCASNWPSCHQSNSYRHAPATRLGSVDHRHHQIYRSAVAGPGQTRVFSVALATDLQNVDLGEYGPRASH